MQDLSPADFRGNVLARLDAAGETLMALPARGCFPASWGSSPVWLQIPAGAAVPRFPRPAGRAITLMEEVYLRWIPLLPGESEHQRAIKRLVLLRTLNWPMSERGDPHVWSWRRLGEEFHTNDKTAAARFGRAVDWLAWRLQRLPEPCAATLGRITARMPRSELV